MIKEFICEIDTDDIRPNEFGLREESSRWYEFI